MGAWEEPSKGNGGGDGPPGRVRVIVADDHPVFRDGIAAAVDERSGFEVRGTVGDGPGALEAIRRERPEVALLDIRMPRFDARRLLRALAEEELPTRVVFLSAHVESELAHSLVSAGASGYLSKIASREEICEAVATVARGGTALAPEVESALISALRRREGDRAARLLTAREEDVMSLLAEGCSAREIATRMQISEGTVRSHLRGIYEKLGVSGQAAAVAEAMRRGVIE
jgi:two-component system, NarL family, nitrate/nitrite response regulator NarL